jgi:hypothetical protein
MCELSQPTLKTLFTTKPLFFITSLTFLQTKLYQTERSLSESWRARSKTRSGSDVASVIAFQPWANYRVLTVAYQLALPSQSKLHPVFHVSCLNKVIGTRCQLQTNLPELAEERSIWLQPEAILDQREHRLHQHIIKEVLIQWKDMTSADATWEPDTILQQFPHLKP